MSKIITFHLYTTFTHCVTALCNILFMVCLRDALFCVAFIASGTNKSVPYDIIYNSVCDSETLCLAEQIFILISEASQTVVKYYVQLLLFYILIFWNNTGAGVKFI